MCLHRGHLASVTLGKRERVDEESNKKLIRKQGVRQKSDVPQANSFMYLFLITQSFLLGFSLSSDNITASNKKSTYNKEPTSVSEITI